MKKSIFDFEDEFNLSSPFGDWKITATQEDNSNTEAIKLPGFSVDGLKQLKANSEEPFIEAIIHGSWWADRIFKYIENKESNPYPAFRILEILIIGTFYKRKDDISLFDLMNNGDFFKSLDEKYQDEINYRDRNWGKNNNFPISMNWSKDEGNKMSTFSAINNELKTKGKAVIKIFTEAHDEHKNIIPMSDPNHVLSGYGTITIEKAKGLKDKLGGAAYWSAWFVMNSPFGKLFRNVGKDRDTWNGEKLNTEDKILLTLDGILDLMTLGTGPMSAMLSQGLGVLVELSEQLENDFLQDTKLAPYTKEIIELVASGISLIKDGEKYAIVEIFANLIQFGLIGYSAGHFMVNTDINTDTADISKRFIVRYTP